MKTLNIFLILFLFCTCMLNAQNKLFEKFAEMDGVTSVYISKTMLSLMPNMKTNGMDIGGIANKLELIQILTSEKAEVAAMMRQETRHFAKGKDYEELMCVKDESIRVNFYVKKNGDKIKELVMLIDDDSEFTIIQLIGDLSLKDIQTIKIKDKNRDKELIKGKRS